MQYAAMEFERHVADVIKQLDYKVTIEPWERPDQRTLLDRVYSWLIKPSGSPYTPDILVSHGKKYAVVEAKPYPVLLGPIIQARHYADYFEAPAIVCVPDDAFPEIPESVGELAELNDIVLCPIAQIGDRLKTIFQD